MPVRRGIVDMPIEEVRRQWSEEAQDRECLGGLRRKTQSV